MSWAVLRLSWKRQVTFPQYLWRTHTHTIHVGTERYSIWILWCLAAVRALYCLLWHLDRPPDGWSAHLTAGTPTPGDKTWARSQVTQTSTLPRCSVLPHHHHHHAIPTSSGFHWRWLIQKIKAGVPSWQITGLRTDTHGYHNLSYCEIKTNIENIFQLLICKLWTQLAISLSVIYLEMTKTAFMLLR